MGFGSQNGLLQAVLVADLAINCLFVMALDHFHCICKAIGTEFPYDGLAEKMRGNIRKEFLCDNGLYTMLKGKKQFTVLGNSFAVLSGVAYGADAENICEKIFSKTTLTLFPSNYHSGSPSASIFRREISLVAS